MSFSTDECKLAVARLTVRQREILAQIAEGKSRKQIAAALNLKYKTVEVHCTQLYARLQIHSSNEACRVAHGANLIKAE